MTQPAHRLAIRHTSRYRYEGSGGHLVQALRLTPPAGAAQDVIDWQVFASGIDGCTTYIDAFGNRVHVVSCRDAGPEVEIVAEGVVETRDTGGVLGNTGEAVAAGVFLRPTSATRADAGIVALAEAVRADDRLATMHALMAAVEAQVAYLPDTTHSRTTAAQAFAAGRGVCQDHAQVMIAAARHLGIPARYVSGYLLLTDEGQAAAHHAWMEAHVGSLGWVGFDAANALCPTERYVRLTIGLDAASAAPIRGVHRGAGAEQLAVDVIVGISEQ